MFVHPDDLEEQMRDGQVVTTMLEAVPLVLEASSHLCGVCVTMQSGIGLGNGGEGFGLMVTRVDAQLGFTVSDLTWRPSQSTAPETGMAPLCPTERPNSTAHMLLIRCVERGVA